MIKIFLGKIKSKIQIENGPSVFEWGIAACILFISMTLYSSSDLSVTAAHGVYFVDSIFSGDALKVYTKFHENPMTITAMYDIWLYIIFGIWNIPVYILFKTGVSFQVDLTTLRAFSLLWNKLLLVVVSVILVYLLIKIITQVIENKVIEKWAVYFILTSFLFVFPVCIMGQYDIIPITFSLWGILGYIKNNHKIFLIGFTFAIGMKFFAFFIFIPLLILKQKNIYKIFLNIAISFFLPLLAKLLYMNDPAYSYAKEFASDKINLLLQKTLPGNFSSVPVIVVLLLFLYIYCYLKRPSEQEIKYYSMFIPFIVYGTLFSFMEFGTYWIIMLIPFITAVIFFNSGDLNKFRTNILLTSTLEFSTVFLDLYYHHDNLDYLLLEKGFLKYHFISIEVRHSFFEFVNINKLDRFMPVVVSIFLVCIISLVVLNFPSKNFKITSLEKVQNYDRSILLLRSASTIIFIVITFISYGILFNH